MIPEKEVLFESLREDNKYFKAVKFETSNEENGIDIKVYGFDLDKEFDNIDKSSKTKSSKLLTNVVYIVDSYKWWN